jgi:hypothetical protein
MKTLITIIIFFISTIPSQGITVVDANHYAGLMFEPIDFSLSQKFNSANISKQDLSWFIDTENYFYDYAKSDDELSMAIAFDQSGKVSKLTVRELSPELSLEEFKKILAKVSQLKLPINQPSNFDNFYFDFFTRWGFLDYGQAVLKDEKKPVQKVLSTTNLEVIERLLKSQQEFKASLYKPEFLEYPYIGQPIEFYLPLLNTTKISGYIEDLDNSLIKIRFSEISSANERLIIDMKFLLDQTNEDFSVLGAKILGTALSSASSAGFLGSALTNGILPGAYAVLGTASVIADEHQKTRSFCLSKGDEVILKMEEKK